MATVDTSGAERRAAEAQRRADEQQKKVEQQKTAMETARKRGGLKGFLNFTSRINTNKKDTLG